MTAEGNAVPSPLIPMVIPGPRVFGPCPKCSEIVPSVVYHDGARRHCWLCKVESCRFSDVCGDNGREGEHLAVRCRRCHFAWIEETEPVPG